MARIAVLVVDDSVVVRRLVSDVLSSDPAIEVVGVASNGKIAIAKIPQLNPDIVTLDVEMPVMDGLETLVRLRELYPRLPVIMFSTVTERGASATLDALERGANDYVTKPANVGSVSASMDAVKAQLIPKIKSLTLGRRGAAPTAPARVPLRPVVARPAATAASRVDVVVVGVSTGGPDALTTVVTALPPDLPVPVVVVQHMPPVFTALFAKRLDTKSHLTVTEARTGDRVQAGRVLIAPGDFHLRLRANPAGAVAHLDQGTPENYCRPAVDVLFRSAAEVVRPRGAGRRAHRHGIGRNQRCGTHRAGRGIRRRPGRGDVGGMGHARIGGGRRPGGRGAASRRHRARHPGAGRARPSARLRAREVTVMTIATVDFDFISTLVRERSAIVLEQGKEYLIEARLLPLARERGTGSVAELVRELRRSPSSALRDLVVEAMTTNETSFFRDVHPFNALSDHILPDLLRARSGDRALNIWSAACSSGQEPYSIAMLINDIIGADPTWKVRLLATDISPGMLNRTREGVYSQFEVNRGLPAAMLVRYFRKQGLHWQIEEPLRRMVETRLVNLNQNLPPMAQMDIVFMRNVLIYFDSATKRQILARVRRVMRPDGYLVLGGAETTLNLDDSFVRVQIGRAPVYRLHGGKGMKP